MNVHIWLLYVGASVVLLAIPGPTALIVMRSAAGARGRDLPRIVSGAVAGDIVAMTLCDLGLGALLATSAQTLTICRIAAAIYLVALGIWSLCRPEPIAAAAVAAPRRAFASVFLVTALNPKGIAFFAAFLPQFIDAGADVPLQLAILQVTFAGLSLMAACLWAIVGLRLRTAMRHGFLGKRVRQASGLFLIGAGLAESVAKIG